MNRFSFWSAVAAGLGVVLTVLSPARAQDKELNLYAWSEYVPQTVIDKFTEETGIKVNYETYASNSRR